MQPFEFFVLLSGAIANSFCSGTLFHFFAPLFPPSPPSTLTFRVKESSKPLSIGYGFWMCWNPDNYRRKCRRSALKDESNNFEGKLQELKRDVQKMKMAKERGKWETKRDVEESNKDRHERVNMENRALAEWRINIARIMMQFQGRARTRIISRDMIVSSRRRRRESKKSTRSIGGKKRAKGEERRQSRKSREGENARWSTGSLADKLREFQCSVLWRTLDQQIKRSKSAINFSRALFPCIAAHNVRTRAFAYTVTSAWPTHVREVICVSGRVYEKNGKKKKLTSLKQDTCGDANSK